MSLLENLLAELPWLRDEALEVCVVGSTALAVACDRKGLPPPPSAHDVDLAWNLDLREAQEFCRANDLSASQTTGSESRGTIAIRSASQRLEITSFRGGGSTPAERIQNDAERRDMTIGAILWRLHDDSIHDPLGGLEDWRRGIVRACGDAGERIREHPVRLLRYLRRATELSFTLDTATRSAIANTPADCFEELLPEALAEELRRIVTLDSPGVFFAMAYEEGVLDSFLPELAPLFDGRLAGRLRWHPEMSQGLHTVLTMHCAARIADRDRLGEAERRRLMLGVLFHDLGKGLTNEATMPSHPGHEAAGVPLIDAIFDRIPGLGDKRCRRFCRIVARHHLSLAKLRESRAGTLAEMWNRDLAPLREDFSLFASAVRADREGRLRPELLGIKPRQPEFDPGAFERGVLTDLVELDAILKEVRGDEVAAEFPGQPDKIRERLHELRCNAIHAARYREKPGRAT